MENLFQCLSDALKPVNFPVMPLAAIWLKKPVMTSQKITHRITEGDKVFIEDGELKDCLKEPTHIITQCRGKATSDFSINVMDLKTNELSTINL